jgi:Cys-Gly metallodipeptidase DUG1
MELPVNLLFCLEGMEESGSEGLDALIAAEAQGFFQPADCVVISDNYWLGTQKPCLTYGLRGVSTYAITVTGPAKDLHSGVFGGVVHEPMTDLVQVMSKLVDNKGACVRACGWCIRCPCASVLGSQDLTHTHTHRVTGHILIPGIYDTVAPVTPEELKLYETLDFSMADVYASIGNRTSISTVEREALMARWRYPSLSLHGIEGAFSGPGSKTVIPARVVGKFSLRTVPNQAPEEMTRLVQAYIARLAAEQQTKCSITVECGHAGGCAASVRG